MPSSMTFCRTGKISAYTKFQDWGAVGNRKNDYRITAPLLLHIYSPCRSAVPPFFWGSAPASAGAWSKVPLFQFIEKGGHVPSCIVHKSSPKSYPKALTILFLLIGPRPVRTHNHIFTRPNLHPHISLDHTSFLSQSFSSLLPQLYTLHPYHFYHSHQRPALTNFQTSPAPFLSALSQYKHIQSPLLKQYSNTHLLVCFVGFSLPLTNWGHFREVTHLLGRVIAYMD